MMRQMHTTSPRLLVAVAVAAVVPTAGCDTTQGTAAGEDLCGLYAEASPGPFRPDVPLLDAKPFVGKTLPEAQSLAEREGGSLRVVGEDGRCMDALSDDLRGNRVNVYLDDGEVAEARTF